MSKLVNAELPYPQGAPRCFTIAEHLPSLNMMNNGRDYQQYVAIGPVLRVICAGVVASVLSTAASVTSFRGPGHRINVHMHVKPSQIATSTELKSNSPGSIRTDNRYDTRISTKRRPCVPTVVSPTSSPETYHICRT
jgi:hypothetical protein